MQKHEVTLDLIKETQVIPDEIIMRVGEGDTQIIEATLKSHGDDYDVPEGWMPALCLLTAAGNTKIQPAQAEGNIVTVTLADEMLTDEGTCKLAYIRLIGPDNEVQTTEGFKLRVQGTVVTGTTVRSWDGQLADLITEFEQQIELIKASEQVRIQNEGIRQSQEQTRQDQEATRQSQEATREENETARKNAEKLREAAETKRDTQEQARVAAEAQRETDEAARKTAESARDTAESERETQEAQRQANEQTRQTQEETRETKEGERDAAEAQRKQDETARQSQETTRESNESTRQEQEQARQDAEAARDSKEDTRDRAEAQRKANEIERQRAEMQRRSNMTTVMQNETERQAAEAEREKQQAKNNADQANNNLAAQGRITYICQEGEYDPVTYKPTIVGDLAHIYAVPLGEEATEANQYREWLWVIDSGSPEGRWEEYGSGAGTLPEPITTDEYDRMWAGETVESKHMAYAAGESYNVAAAKAAIAKGVSDHDIAVRTWVQDEATAHEAAHAAVAAKIGTETVGAAGKPIYLENGVPVAIEKVDAAKSADSATTATTAESATAATTAEKLGADTVGSETKPIYLNEGRPVAIEKVGSAETADSAGSADKLGTTTVGDETKPVYFKDGVPLVTNIAIVTTEAAGFCPQLSGEENEVLNGKGDFVPIMAEPSLPDKRPLKALVASATEMHDGAFTGDAQDPTLGTWKSTTEAIQALQAAIDAAQGVLDEYGESVLKQSELDAAQAELQQAIDTFKSQSTEVTANLEAYDALKKRIDAVNEKAKESADGKDVTFSSQYVLTADKTTIDRALDACDVAILAATKQSQIDSAVSTLSGAVSTYENAVKTATADYSALDAALAVANAAKKDVVVSEDGSELPAGSRYVTDQATLDAINTAVETATTARSEATTQKMLDDATAALTTATRTFEGKVQTNWTAPESLDGASIDDLVRVCEMAREDPTTYYNKYKGQTITLTMQNTTYSAATIKARVDDAGNMDRKAGGKCGLHFTIIEGLKPQVLNSAGTTAGGIVAMPFYKDILPNILKALPAELQTHLDELTTHVNFASSGTQLSTVDWKLHLVTMKQWFGQKNIDAQSWTSTCRTWWDLEEEWLKWNQEHDTNNDRIIKRENGNAGHAWTCSVYGAVVFGVVNSSGAPGNGNAGGSYVPALGFSLS